MKSAWEAVLFKGYGVDPRRVEPCAWCGGEIRADALDQGTWQPAVMAHRRTELHRRALRRMGR